MEQFVNSKINNNINTTISDIFMEHSFNEYDTKDSRASNLRFDLRLSFFLHKKGLDMEKLALLGKNLKKLVKKIAKIKFKRW